MAESVETVRQLKRRLQDLVQHAPQVGTIYKLTATTIFVARVVIECIVQITHSNPVQLVGWYQTHVCVRLVSFPVCLGGLGMRLKRDMYAHEGDVVCIISCA